MVVAAEEGVDSSLEFITYRKKVEAYLQSNGYSIVMDPQLADYIALVSYGIGPGQTKTVTTPIWGTVGFGTRYYTQAVPDGDGGYTYTRIAYSMPIYGMVGRDIDQYPSYELSLAMDIVEAKSFREGEARKVYEGRTSARSSCGVMVEVFDELLQAMFADFPGENGRNRKMTVEGEFNC